MEHKKDPHSNIRESQTGEINSDDLGKSLDRHLAPPQMLLGFLNRNLEKFSRGTQNIIGLIIVVLLAVLMLHAFVAPTYIGGKLYIKESKSQNKGFAKGYIVEYKNQENVVNDYGNWILPLRNTTPRKVRVQIMKKKKQSNIVEENMYDRVGEFSFYGPWPIVNAIYPLDYEVTIHNYLPEKENIEVAKSSSQHNFFLAFMNLFDGTKKAYAQSSTNKRSWQVLPITVHLQGIGDIYCNDSEWCGTKGESRRLEGFRIKMNRALRGRLTLKYSCHLQSTGDTGWKDEGEFCGTRGQSRRLEGFKIRLEGRDANLYNINYQAHLQGKGDTRIFRNGQFAGTRGQSRRVEAIRVWLERR